MIIPPLDLEASIEVFLCGDIVSQVDLVPAHERDDLMLIGFQLDGFFEIGTRLFQATQLIQGHSDPGIREGPGRIAFNCRVKPVNGSLQVFATVLID